MTNPDWPGKSPVDHRAISILRFLAIFDVARLSPTQLLAQVLPDPALIGMVPPRFNCDQGSNSCHHKGNRN
jgi:hypothetical protein